MNPKVLTLVVTPKPQEASSLDPHSCAFASQFVGYSGPFQQVRFHEFRFRVYQDRTPRPTAGMYIPC